MFRISWLFYRLRNATKAVFNSSQRGKVVTSKKAFLIKQMIENAYKRNTCPGQSDKLWRLEKGGALRIAKMRKILIKTEMSQKEKKRLLKMINKMLAWHAQAANNVINSDW